MANDLLFRTLKRIKKQENNEQNKSATTDIYYKYDKMSSSAHSMILADLHQNNQISNANQNLNSTASYKELLEFQLKEKSEKYRKAKKKLKKKDKRIKQLEDQAEEWRKKCFALLEAKNNSNNTDSNNNGANIIVNKSK
jgi:predicted nucleic acid-binding protein